ncbi:MAG: polysaccharide biosynthesis protein [Deltaproteobacteria bacterium CG07_land_8_20_14_0_80_38_7]|nr:MAG: polysaccharide biosynthesis protein [Deltaproteobacteria bacterium CG07_land_8_20_14_0_80_38_7]
MNISINEQKFMTKFTRDTMITGLSSLFLSVKNLITLPFITKFLGAEIYGVWAQLLVTLGFLVPVACIGLPFALVRFLAAEKNRKKIQDSIYSVLIVVLLVSIIFAILLFLASSSISTLFDCDVLLIKMLSLVVILESMNTVLINIYRAFCKMKKYAFYSIIQVALEVGLVIFMILMNGGIIGALASLIISRVVVLFIMLAELIKEVGISFPRFMHIKEYLFFGAPTVPGNISLWVLRLSDRYLIGWFLGMLAVGYYAPSYIVASSVVFFIAPLSIILPAVLSKLFDENKLDEVRKYLKYSFKYFLAVAIPSVFGLSILSKQILIAVSTQEIADQAYLVVPFVALSSLFWGCYAIISQVFSLVKKTKINAKLIFVTGCTNFVLNMLFIPWLGILGAAFTTLIGYLLLLLLGVWYAFKEFAFGIDWDFIAKSVFSSVIMSVPLVLLHVSGLSQLVGSIFLGMVVYIISIFVFGGIHKKEIQLMKCCLMGC